MSENKRAHSVEQAAWTHLQVFTQPVWHWPAALAAALPDFADLYVPPAHSGRGPDEITRLRDLLRRPSGPAKVLLTGQKGSGKSWGLKWLAQELAPQFAVVSASASDSTGVTMPDADVGAVLLLICEALVQRIEGVPSLEATASRALSAWLTRMASAQNLPEAPTPVEATAEFGIGTLKAWFAKVALRLRSDADLREKVRSTPADDLLLVTEGLLKLIRDGKREPLVILDDVDKINLESAHRIFFEQYGILARLNTRLVLTCPVSLALEGVVQATGGTLPLVFLRNVKVVDRDLPLKVLPGAVEHFRALLGKLIDPSLVEDEALQSLARLSGGVTREFGQLLARAAIVAFYDKADRIDLGAVEQAATDARIELERATQDRDIRARLRAVHTTHRMDTELDHRLLNRNMVIEYVNGTSWYDVHPLLAGAVDAWGGP